MRQRVVVHYKTLLTATTPHKALTKKLKTRSGRNNRGVITTRHQGSGVKKVYREIDFMQNKLGVVGRVETIEYDPYRSAFISLVSYKDGDRRYVITPQNLKVGDEIVTNEQAELKPGNRLMLKNIPIGYFVHNVELRPGSGGKIARSAGSFVEILGSSSGLTDLKLGSKEVRRVHERCWASVGRLSGEEHRFVVLGKAGRSRWMGIRPTVRGSAMNPVDHPYGGGEGRAMRGTRRPKNLWGKGTRGVKTRRSKKYSNGLIVERRKK